MSYTTHADLGGEPGLGPVLPQAGEQLFHEAWEPAALAIVLAMGATASWNIDMSRSARETLPAYRGLAYYRIWLAALERLMLERGLLQADELAASGQRAPKIVTLRAHGFRLETMLAPDSQG